MGSGNTDADIAVDLGKAIAENNWVLISGGRNSGIMDAVNRGAKQAKPPGLTIGILPGDDKKKLSNHVDVAIITDMGNARNNINILSSDIVIACGVGGAGTASEIALALKSGKDVILLNASPESKNFFRTIGTVHETKSVDETIKLVKKMLGRSSETR